MPDKDYEAMKEIFNDLLNKATEANVSIISGRLSQLNDGISMEVNLLKKREASNARR